MPHKVPLTITEPELVVIIDPSTRMPAELDAPFAALPVMVILPAPLAEMLEDEVRKTPVDPSPVPQEVPLTVSEPELVVTQAPLT